ncbi:MAG: helix-hairpin-helix domain-containing protein [Bacteroidetes bacterium]|nr:helix-hairpin-helix domain-containing protein [Bacteroidota bacterium]
MKIRDRLAGFSFWLSEKIGLSLTEFRFLAGFVLLTSIALSVYVVYRNEQMTNDTRAFEKVDSIYRVITLSADSLTGSEKPVLPLKPVLKKVNLNTATLAELMTLPGVGEKTAEAIIRYRTEAGWFQSAAELENIPGLGPKKISKILPELVPDSLLSP